jgi:hypothetical protein
MNVRALICILAASAVAAFSGCSGAGGGGDDHVPVWQTVGDKVSTGAWVLPVGISIAVHSGVPYVAYAEGAGVLHVKKFKGGAWVPVGPDPVATSVFLNNAGLTLAVYDDSNMYVTYYSVGAAPLIVKYDGTSWAAMTNPFPAGSSSDVVALNGATPYVQYTDSALKTCVQAFTTAWNSVGTSFGGDSQALCIYGGVPYTAYRQTGGTWRASVKSFTTSWQQVGDADISTGDACPVSLFSYAESGQVTHYVAYADQATLKVTVKKNAGTAAWNTLGAADFTPKVSWLSISAFNGTPYLAYMTDASETPSLTPYVEKFNGTTWELVGGASPLDQPNINPVAFCLDGAVPYVAMHDITTNDLIVKKFE